ncbi:unnamed protein product [Soboliphyme baturini]|uniref:PRPF3 n=1 Tax=Soboliphyme baturini TaxID=241478 RepID=A0A183I9T8_9BILA|nr:unnamed protein product [Soboliphyme baturini]
MPELNCIEEAVKNVLGSSSHSVVSVLQRGLDKGYSRKKFTDRLFHYVKDEAQIRKLLDLLLEEIKTPVKERRKRSRFEETPAANGIDAKMSKLEVFPSTLIDSMAANAPNTEKPQNEYKIHEIMLQAQRMIEERKRVLRLHPAKIAPEQAKEFMNESLEKAKRASDLQASIANRLPALLSYQSFGRQPGKPTPLILNSEGRAIDSAGQEIQLTHRIPTLKVHVVFVRSVFACHHVVMLLCHCN